MLQEMEDLDFLLHKGINPFVRRNKNEKSLLSLSLSIYIQEKEIKRTEDI